VADHIPLCARIVAVADVFDALTSPRPYKQAWPAERAFQYLAAQRGRHFDPRLADAFVSLRKEIMEIQTEWQDPRPAAASPRA
jgi:putative two-component system response regulator